MALQWKMPSIVFTELKGEGGQGGRESFPGGLLLALRLLHSLLDTGVGRFSQISLFHFRGNVLASM